MAQWKIERRQGACTACEREFADRERHASQLYTGEDGGLARRDLCDGCWRKVADGVEDEGLFYWYTRHQVQERQTVQLDLASLERLFVELEGREELKVRELRYVLCLLLMRKRRVKLERVIRDGENESFRVKRPRIDERYTVHVFDFDAERVAQIRAELQAIFDGADGEEGISLAHLTDEPEPVEGDAVADAASGESGAENDLDAQGEDPKDGAESAADSEVGPGGAEEEPSATGEELAEGAASA